MVIGDNATQTGWLLNHDLFAPGNESQSSAYVQSLFFDVSSKKFAGFWNVTFADFWARALSYHFLPGTSEDNFFNASAPHGAATTFSSATELCVSETLPIQLKLTRLCTALLTRIVPCPTPSSSSTRIPLLRPPLHSKKLSFRCRTSSTRYVQKESTVTRKF